jgi:hypothetical protein
MARPCGRLLSDGLIDRFKRPETAGAATSHANPRRFEPGGPTGRYPVISARSEKSETTRSDPTSQTTTSARA